MKTTIKPLEGQIGVKGIYRDGKLVGEYDFSRWRAGGGALRTSGELRAANGKTIRLDNWAYDADVAHAIRSGQFDDVLSEVVSYD